MNRAARFVHWNTVVVATLGIAAFAGCGAREADAEGTAEIVSALSLDDSARVQDKKRGSISGPVDFGTIDLTSIGVGACTGPKAARLWTLTNRHGLVAKLTDFGATL